VAPKSATRKPAAARKRPAAKRSGRSR
jgi:hypothetical protein